MNNEETTGTSVSYACLQGPIFVPDVGQHGPTLSVNNIGLSKITKMTLFDNVLLVEIVAKGRPFKIRVPTSMVSHALETRSLTLLKE